MSYIKVLHVCSDTNIGGAGKYLLNLYKTKSQDIDLYFLLPKHSQLTSLLVNENAKVIELDIAPNKSMSIKDIYIISKLLKKLRPDIVHTHANLTARICAKLTNIGKIIYTRHYVQTNTKPLNKIKKFLNNFLCDGVIGVTQEIKEILLNMGIDNNKIKIIENGVLPIEKHINTESIKNKLNILPDKKVVTILSRLSPEKGIDRFIEIVAELNKTNNNVVALIAGAGREETHLNALIQELGLDTDKIKMLGFIQNVSDILNITDVILNTSTTEAKSLSILEAMSLGIPAIVSHVGGNPSLVEDNENGFVVEQHDITGFVDKINLLLSDKHLYDKMSSKSSEKFSKNYNAQKMTNQTELFYINILKKKER
ncbi:hypothetical protein AN641_02055 [Candidatus Epulonipiscioides gigas]|nr:hypothetical protein AN641_02055 [Epulopiscium sp. SCG-C07WGA-EpuloA2]